MLERLRQVISENQNKAIFFNIVRNKFGHRTAKFNLIKDAYVKGRKAFRYRRRHSGEAYFTHKVAVAVIIMVYLGINDANLVAAALLHDIIEDIKGWNKQKLIHDFNPEVANLVDAVTKPDRALYGENEHEYEKAIFAKVRKGGDLAIILKLADRLHNMITLWGNREKKLAKVLETLRYVLPMAVEKDILWQELTAACAEQINLSLIEVKT